MRMIIYFSYASLCCSLILTVIITFLFNFSLLHILAVPHQENALLQTVGTPTLVVLPLFVIAILTVVVLCILVIYMQLRYHHNKVSIEYNIYYRMNEGVTIIMIFILN